MESYKEKYEQALEIAKETYDTQPMYREWLEKMFPELLESEDEKIRKELTQNLKERFGTHGSMGGNLDMPRVLAWLEKQGNPADKLIPKFKVGDKIYLKPEYRMPDDDTPIANTVFEIRAIDDKYYRFDGSYIFIEDQDKYELVEQNPAWNEEEERYICQLESMVKERWALSEKAQDEEVIKNMSNLAFFLKTLKKPSGEDMKALLRTEYEKGRADAIAEMQGEWSEEDIIHLNNCISYMSRLDSSEMDWLKSLNGRVQPQSKTEWSEEDSRILYNVKAYIGYAAGQRGVRDELFKEANEWLNSLPIGFIYNKNYNEDMVTLLVGELKQIANDNNAPEQYQVEINWLKSLRPQNRWKPSDKQMEALWLYAEQNNYDGAVLTSLYNDLKKLTE